MAVLKTEFDLTPVTIEQLLSFLKANKVLQVCHICSKTGWMIVLDDTIDRSPEQTPVAVFENTSQQGSTYYYYHVVCTNCGCLQQINTYFVNKYFEQNKDEK